MALLTKQEILKANDSKVQEVDVPEWGGSVRVKGLNALQRQQRQKEIVKAYDDKGNPILNMDAIVDQLPFLAMVLVDGNDNPLFTEVDLKELGSKNPAILDRLAKVGRELSGLEQKAVEEAAKN